MREKIHVVEVINSLDIGGAEELLKNLTFNLNSDRIKMTLLALRNVGEIGKEIATDSDVRVIDLDLPKGFTPLNFLVNLKRLTRELSKLEPDILHSHIWESSFYGRISGMFLRVPVKVISVHSTYKNRKPRHKVIDRLLARVTDRIIAVSDAVKEFTVSQEKIPESKFETIYNGVDTSGFGLERSREEVRKDLGIGKETGVVISVGTLKPRKGMRYLVKKSLGSRYPRPWGGAFRPIHGFATAISICLQTFAFISGHRPEYSA